MMNCVQHLGDGAMGTSLLPYSSNPDSLNLTAPERVASLHREYVEAGSSVIRTNTFGHPGPTAEGAKIALAACNGAEVWGTMGPGLYLASRSEIPVKQLQANYLSHIRLLLSSGIHHLHIETCIDPLNLEAALRAAGKAEVPELSVSAFLPESGGTPLTLQDLLAITREYGVTHLGLNCMPPSTHTSRMAERLLAAPHVSHLSLFPCGDDLPPESWAKAVADNFGSLPLHTLGGCCGTTPAHIRSLHQTLQ